MEVVGTVCAVVLAGVFVWAGAAKLARPEQTAAGFRSLRLPAPGVLARLVPTVELLLAVLLIAWPEAGGGLALCLLILFTGVLVAALAVGVTAGCACFGTTATRPLSARQLLRNAVLAALAVAAVVL